MVQWNCKWDYTKTFVIPEKINVRNIISKTLFSVDLIEDDSTDDDDSGGGDDTTDENDENVDDDDVVPEGEQEKFDIQIPLQHRVRSATL